MEGKVLQWNRTYLNSFVIRMWEQRGSCLPKVSTEEIGLLPIIPITKPHTPSPKGAPIGLWVPTEWSQHLVKSCFTGGSSNLDGTKTNREWQPMDWGMANSKEGTTKSA